ncbi:MAG TPA: hypothetical protein VKE94_10935 [Gemmataceae bacterium]|nr:hypothetical protein [Gemmataceae bacterium]
MGETPSTTAVTAAPPPQTVSVRTLGLSVALAVSTTAAVVFAILYFLRAAPSAGTSRAHVDEPHVQKATVLPDEGAIHGIVFYPIPYTSPPNLALTCPSRTYRIVKQDESGFTWLAQLRKEEEATSSISPPGLGYFINAPKPGVKLEEFTWEAKGVRSGADGDAMRVFEQTGTFQTVLEQQGDVRFPIPYTLPPNVELEGKNQTTVVTECTATGFKWRNPAKQPTTFDGNVGPVTWKAKGIKATAVPK